MQSTERSTRSSKRYAAEPAPGPPNMDTGQYMCIECSQTFDNKLELNSHRQSHVTKKQFTCSHCGRGFHHQVFLQMHERSHDAGISRTSLTKTTAARVISTRSSKASLDADIIHVAPPANKPTYRLNSKVQFKRELSASRDINPRECLTRRTQGTSPPAHQQTDSSDKKAQFELRISKLSDSTIHLIDPYGNTLEILAEVFNAYTIGETEEDVENVSPIADSRTSEISAASTSSSVHLNVPDEIVQDSRVLPSPQAEASRPHEPINTGEKKEDLPLCCIQSVSSASMSPKTLPDLSDDVEDVLPTQTPRESDIQDVTSSEHTICQPANELPNNSTEEENPPSISQDSLTTCDHLMVTEKPILGDVTVCNRAGPDQTETPSLNPDALNHPSSVQWERPEVLHGGHLHAEDKPCLSKPMPPEPLTNLNPEKDASTSSLTPVTSNEQDISLTVASSISGLSLDLNEGSAQLSDSRVNDGQSDIAIENDMQSQKRDEGGAGLEEDEQLDGAEVPLTSADKSQEVPLVEDDSMTLQTPLTPNEGVSKTDELHVESLSCTRDPGSLGHDSNLQTDLSAPHMTPVDDKKVDPKCESQTGSMGDLKPGSTEANVCSLSDGASYAVDICSSELKSQNVGMSLDSADQRTIGSSNFEAAFMKRDTAEKVFTSLEGPESQSVMPEKIPQASRSTVPFLQDQCQEPLLADGPAACNDTGVVMHDPCQKNDGSSERNPKSIPDMSSPLRDMEALMSNDQEKDENLESKSEMEADISDIRQIGSSENELRNLIAAPVAPPAEALPLANVDNKLDEALSHENIQTPEHGTKSDVENMNSSQKIAVVESGEDQLLSLLEPVTEAARGDLLPPCDEDLSLRNNSEDVSFSVQTLVNLTSACVQAQEHVLSQGTKPPDQDAAESMESEVLFRSSSLIGNAGFKDDVLLEKPKVEVLLPALCLLEPTLALSSDLEDLSEKCLLSSDVKDLADNDLDKDLSHEVPHKQYIQMSNADLTENDLTDDFVDSGTILLDAPSLEEATKEDLSAVSVDDESTVHELSDMLSPDLLDSEYTEGLDDKQGGFRGQCLKCGRRVRRGRKELVWFPDCYKCRLKAKREDRRSGEDTGHSSDLVLETGLDRKKGSPDFSNFHVKQEAESAQDSTFYRAESPPLKTFKCPKCEKSFRKSALLALHVKCHSLPQCLSCGCPVPLDYKTKRTPKRCHKCVQKIKQQKAERVLSGDEDDSLDSDSESPFVDEVDLESLSDNEPEDDQSLSSTRLEEGSGSVNRGTEPFHSILMRQRKKMSPAIQALYCTCEVVLKSGTKLPKICKSCQKPTRDRLVAVPKGSLLVGHHAGVAGQVPQLKKTKKQTQSEPDQPNVSLGDSSMSCENELSPDEFSKEETETITELDISDQMVLPDGKEPRLCPQCGKIFKCNRSMKLHLLSHSATQCESCGCRLQKKKRAGRWAKKCRVCRLLTKVTGLPDGAVEDVPPSDKISKEKGMASLRRKMKQSKAVRHRKIQPIAKHKKDLKWMNMMLAVKGLTRKPRRKKREQTMKDPNEEKSGYSSEPSVYSGTVGKATFLKHLSASPKSDPGSSGLHLSQKKLLGGIQKINRKCMYKKKNIIKVEEQQMSPYIGDPSKTQVSVKEEDENQCLECNEIFPSFDLLLSHQQSHVGDQPFTCTQCPQSFSAEQYLSIHVGSHAEGPPFRCPECNKTFPKRNNLGVHRRVHSGARPFACPDCPCRFRQRGSLILHRYTHRNLQFMMSKPYQCSICNKSFKQKERLVIHERLHTGECPFSCKNCDKVFPSKSRLYAHRKIHKAPGTLSNVEQNASCKEELGELPYQCKECGKVCSTKASLVLHSKVHKSSAISKHGGSHVENVQTSKEMPLVSESNLIKTEPEGHPFTCKDCNKVCSTKASLVLHRKVHGLDRRPGFGSPGFVCKDCHKVCSTKAKLILHRKMHKSSLICGLKANIGDPPYVCQDCNKVCSTKASFVLHCKVHRKSSSEHILKGKMEQKSFVCKVCNFVCSTKASFVLHRKLHRSSPSPMQSLKDGTVQNPFACKVCSKVCSTKASLVLHSKVHRALLGSDQNPIPQADVEEKPYHCKECGKIYSTKGRLLSHMKLHIGQEMSENAGQQLNMDTEEKPFACPICQMRFTRLKILVRHKLIHGEDVFKCGHCGKRFLFHKSLMNHVPVCLKRSKGKSPLGKEKVRKKRKTKDGNSSEESAPKKRKPDNKKAMTAVQKLKNKKLIKAKKLAIKKEKNKAKGSNEKKLKKAKGDSDQEPDPEGESQSEEKPMEAASKEKEIGKDKKPKEIGKVKKVLKKVPVKQKRQKVGSESLKKWRMIAAATVKKRKLQAVITGGKKKVTVKKKGPNKAKTGGKSSKE